MVDAPESHIAAFADAGADLITVHWEASRHLHRVVEQVRERGIRAGVALNPATPSSLLQEVLPLLDLVLIMTVNPGWGGQRYIPASTAKVEDLGRILRDLGSAAPEIEVDGGIDTTTAGQVVRAGASVLVAGSAVFNQRGSVADNLAALRQAANA
ncbi:MAG: Ribulose-phosphate 3-epimerase [uncultured Gemmatimonadetes bacterium]|uniref:Ribulose-phosphate 3-epimerase n=1 Tax=uncultured Gemmatimonadota bacterium TaxID=203437 RepID=A0A6J4MP62_9BACT|nr:MAG: Ribulose-phosphate 3-epimerase [uncultured Gemmatimonadota bacterium]